MAINYTISYTFSPSTTISSSQVNTNFSDNANVWTGLEAKTKTFAALQLDATPTAAADVVRKDYVDTLFVYRRPVLQYSSGTVVNIETGINGTSGQARILFPDGTQRTDSTSGRINCNLAQVAALSGAWQSGVRTGTVSANTWYAIYAVKTTDDTAKFVTVADTVLPLQANFATLNSNFGANGWVYLGVVPYGDNSGATTAVPKFLMAGNRVMFYNACTGSASVVNPGVRLATTAGATTLTYTYAAGTALGSAQVPNHLPFGMLTLQQQAGLLWNVTDSAAAVTVVLLRAISSTSNCWKLDHPLTLGIINNPGTSCAQDVILSAYTDAVLGVGSNPII